MSVVSFATQIFFLFSTIGFTFICDEGEQTISLLVNLLSIWWNVVCGPWVLICYSTVLATSCQIYPSEYAYHADSVNRAESVSANCRRYPPSSQGQSIHPEDYIHCDGTQLKLADFNLGQEQYQSVDYYLWPTGSDGNLLFIFPTVVSLTTITLHYYSANVRGLPRLRFYAVSDDFDIWDGIATSYSHVDVAVVPPDGEPAGCRNVSINVNFNTKKMLMYKFRSSFQFAVSEVKFFACNGKWVNLQAVIHLQYTFRACITISAPFTTTEAITTTSQPTIAATSITSVTTPLIIPPMVTTTNTGEVGNYVDE